MVNSTRRTVLRIGSIAATLGVTGCSQLRQGSPFTAGGTGSDESGAFEPWLLAPSKISADDSFLLTSTHIPDVLSYANKLPNIDKSKFESENQLFPTGEIEYLHDYGSISAWTGTFDADPIISDLEERFSKGEQYRGYTMYVLENSAIGVKDGVVLISQDYEGADVRTNLEALIDTGAGNIPRWQENNEVGMALVDHLGEGSAIRINNGGIDYFLDGAVAAGSEIVLGSDQSEVKGVVVYKNENAVDAERVEQHVAQTSFFDGPEQVSVRTDGRTVVGKGTVPTQELQTLQMRFEAGADPDWDQPATLFTTDYRPQGDNRGVLVVTHNGGDPIPKAALEIRGDSFTPVDGTDLQNAGPWAGDASGQIDGEQAVTFGDAINIGVRNDYQISVWWAPPNGKGQAPLRRDSGPAN